MADNQNDKKVAARVEPEVKIDYSDTDAVLDHLALLVHENKEPTKEVWGKMNEVFKNFYSLQRQRRNKPLVTLTETGVNNVVTISLEPVVPVARTQGIPPARAVLETVIGDAAVALRERGHEVIRSIAAQYGKV